MLTYHCSNCGHDRQVLEDYLGKSAKCPKCGASNRISSPPPVPSDQWADEMIHSAKIDEAASFPVIDAGIASPIPHRPVPMEDARQQTRGSSVSFAVAANVLLLAILTAITVIGISLWKVVESQLSILDSKLSAIESGLAVVLTWEYTIESLKDSEFQKTIDRIGEQGWDLVASRRATREVTPIFPWNDRTTEAAYELIFKRPKR